MTKSLLLKAFNKHFFQFLDDVIGFFPNNTDLTSSRQQFDTAKAANPTLLIKIWYKYIFTPYHEQIEAGDLAFFFEKDYSEDLRNLPNHQKIIQVINTSLREPLKLMDESNLDKCRQHFKLVTRIAARYMMEVE